MRIMGRAAVRAASIAVLCVFWSAVPARAVDQTAAQDFVAELGRETVEVLQRPDLTYRQSVEEFRQLFQRHVDIPTIGRFVLGRHWPNATEAQQRQYMELFQDMVIETYARRFHEYAGETLVVVGSRPEGERDVLVETQIVRPAGAPPVNVTWRVRERDGRRQVIDVAVEGVSLAITQRDEFSAVIQRNGGSIDALLNSMNQTIQNARQG